MSPDQLALDAPAADPLVERVRLAHAKLTSLEAAYTCAVRAPRLTFRGDSVEQHGERLRRQLANIRQLEAELRA